MRVCSFMTTRQQLPYVKQDSAVHLSTLQGTEDFEGQDQFFLYPWRASEKTTQQNFLASFIWLLVNGYCRKCNFNSSCLLKFYRRRGNSLLPPVSARRCLKWGLFAASILLTCSIQIGKRIYTSLNFRLYSDARQLVIHVKGAGIMDNEGEGELFSL